MKLDKPSIAKRMAVLHPEGAYAVLNKATALETKGKKIIHFEIGQPDFPTPKNIAEAGIKAIRHGFTKYNPPLGIISLRKRIAEQINESRGLDISEKQIAVTPSGKTAIFTAMAAVLEKGDEVIYPDPGFPTYHALIDLFGAVRKPVPLLEKNSFSFYMRVFHKHFSKKTKLIILNSPSNPTGGVMPMKDLLEIAEAVKNTGCWVMTDEMYSKIIYDNRQYPSYYALQKVQDRTILVDGFSKAFSMTGWRIGYLSAPERIVDKIDYLLTHAVGCTATFTQYAALDGLNGPKEPLKKMVAQFEKRRNFVVDELNKIDGIVCQKPEGAFYVFPNIKSFKKSSKWLAGYILEEAGVALLDGTSFGDFGEGYLRISYATSINNIKEGISLINNALKRLS
jgi:aspartate/methionine/tyrosine aminotransferase